jgi:nitrate reductase NapE component
MRLKKLESLRNKKGSGIITVIVIAFVLFLILLIGFIMAVGNSVLNWTWDEAAPLVSDLGVIEDFNATEAAEITIAPANSFVQSLNWLVGVVYVLMLIGSIALAYTMRGNPNTWIMGFYFMLIFLLVIGGIFMSNIYEDFYDDSGDLGDHLKEQTILSYLILYSPAVMAVIGIITGIIIFSGGRDETYV